MEGEGVSERCDEEERWGKLRKEWSEKGILEVMDERENGLREGVGIGVKGELVHGAGYDMKYNFF